MRFSIICIVFFLTCYFSNVSGVSNKSYLDYIKKEKIRTHQRDLLKIIKGVWVGVGYQKDQDETWDMTLICKSKKNCKISYPTLGCKGTWHLLEYTNDRLVFVERIDDSKNCTNNGEVVIDLIDSNRLRFSYYWPNRKTLGAIGELKRIK